MQYNAFFPHGDTEEILSLFLRYDTNKILLSPNSSWSWCDGTSKTGAKLDFRFRIKDVNEDNVSDIIDKATIFIQNNFSLITALYEYKESKIVQQIGTWQQMSIKDVREQFLPLMTLLAKVEMGFTHSTRRARRE